ncbi:MAG: hypothetical protein IPG50_11845 [Myxococcales bacterium]|nr:hypothetical protein [Myxococcales bacterium]
MLSPRDRLVVPLASTAAAAPSSMSAPSPTAEPSVARREYVWVRRSWPSFAALLDDAIGEAQAELDKRKGLAAATARAEKRAPGKGPQGERGRRGAKLVKQRVVEIRPSKAAKKKPATKKAPPVA